MTSKDDISYLWDGSETGWVLKRTYSSEGKMSGILIFNSVTNIALIVEDEQEQNEIVSRMKMHGVEVID